MSDRSIGRSPTQLCADFDAESYPGDARRFLGILTQLVRKTLFVRLIGCAELLIYALETPRSPKSQEALRRKRAPLASW